MSAPNAMGRRPITVIELEQPRCVHRFGVGVCTAIGTKCYNTQGTCGDLPNYDGAGAIKWRFTDGRPGNFDFADNSDADNQELSALPCLVSVSTSANEINAGSMLDGRSPLGVTGKIRVTMQDFPWNDAWGDFYLSGRSGYVSGRPPPVRANFWALWTARNPLFNDMLIRRYDGYEGQALADMRQSVHVLDRVDGPDDDGKVTLTGLDPLRLAGDKKAEFPRTSKLDLYGDIDAITTTVVVFGEEADLSDAFGNTGATKYLSIGQEIISYTGYTDNGGGRFILTGAARGALDSEASAHKDQDKIQRAGRYVKQKFWLVLSDLLQNHTDIPSAFIPLVDWNTEGDQYLPTYRTTTTIVKPTEISKLSGQLMQQGLFYIWWSEYDREIKMMAVRPPDTDPATFDESSNVMKGAVLKRDPAARITQVSVFYGRIDPFASETDDVNYRRRFVAVDGENLGETRAHAIYAPWIDSRTQAVQLAVRLLIRYRAVPRFLSFSIDAKDRDTAKVGSVLDIETRSIVDSEGNVNRNRWQVISAKELEAGHTYILNCQTYEFVGKFGRYMADGSPNHGAATDEQKKAGGWYAADNGLLPGGIEGYQYQ